MNCAVRERGGERLVDELVLLDQGSPLEAAAGDGHLEVVARSRTVEDRAVALGKGLLEQRLEPLDAQRFATVRRASIPRLRWSAIEHQSTKRPGASVALSCRTLLGRVSAILSVFVRRAWRLR